MANTILVGAQWGDEGKGKIIDVLTEKADVVVRYDGGNRLQYIVVTMKLQAGGYLQQPRKANPRAEGVAEEVEKLHEELVFERQRVKAYGVKDGSLSMLQTIVRDRDLQPGSVFPNGGVQIGLAMTLG